MREIILVNEPIFGSENSDIIWVKHFLIPISRIINVEALKGRTGRKKVKLADLTDEVKEQLSGICSESDCGGSLICYYDALEKSKYITVLETHEAIHKKIYPTEE